MNKSSRGYQILERVLDIPEYVDLNYSVQDENIFSESAISIESRCVQDNGQKITVYNNCVNNIDVNSDMVQDMTFLGNEQKKEFFTDLHLPSGAEKIKVCQKQFLNVLGYTSNSVIKSLLASKTVTQSTSILGRSSVQPTFKRSIGRWSLNYFKNYYYEYWFVYFF